MWALIITGIFSATYEGQGMQIDGASIQMLMEMSGDITIARKGYRTEADCKAELASIEGKHQIKVNGVNITLHTAECKGEEQTGEGKGPKA